MPPRTILAIVAAELAAIILILLFQPLPPFILENGVTTPNCPREENVSALLQPDREGWKHQDTENGSLYHVETNRKGFRTENSFNESNKSLKVVFAGDSQTWGWGVNRSQRYTNLFESMMENSGYSIETLNLGSPGMGVPDYYTIARREAIPRDPDVLVVGLNPGDYASKKINRGTAIKLDIGGTTLRTRPERRLKALLWRGSQRHRCLDIYLPRLRRLDRGWEGEILVFELEERENGIASRMNGELETISAPAAWRNGSAPEAFIFEDRHFNPAGHRQLAERLTSFFRQEYPLGSR